MRRQGVRFLSLAASMAVTATVLAGCGGNSAASGTQNTRPPILIGASLPLTGAFSADGQAFEQGYQLWQSDVNSHGGLLGRQVKLVIVNDASSPTTVVSDYKRLITADHVALTFGPFSSLLTAPAATIAAQYKYAMIEGAGAADSVFDLASNKAIHNVFCTSLPVDDYMVPLVKWITSLPASQRPKTAAYPTAQDPFTAPPVLLAEKLLKSAGIRTVYNKSFPEKLSAYKAPADQVAATGAQLVVLGSTDVPTVQAFMQAFEQQHYSPKIFIAAAGPDQGQAFLGSVGKANATGMMVPGGWYGGYDNALSRVMVEEYIAKYGGIAAGVNADVAEAFSVGEVAADAVKATGSTDNAKIISYLHSKVTLDSVQGPVQFTALGQNLGPAAFVFQWQAGNYSQVLPTVAAGSARVIYPKPNWTG